MSKRQPCEVHPMSQIISRNTDGTVLLKCLLCDTTYTDEE